MHEDIDVSVVIPLFNEEGSLHELYTRLSKVLDDVAKAWEILFIDDGSKDQSPKILDELAQKDRRVGVLRFRRNFGKAAALDAGFKRVRGRLVVTMDADLQDAPEELPNLIKKLDEGFDAVSGWKKKRHDPLGKTLPSKLFNAVVRKVSGLTLHDFNCGYKIYRQEALRELSLYGEMHRYIPVLISWNGFTTGELAVQHEARKHGVSKYGMERFAKGFFDLLTVVLTTKYRTRPLHLFGLAGLLLGFLGVGVLGYLTLLWFLGHGPIGQRPLLFLGLLLVMVGVQFVSTGLLGELMQRNARPGFQQESEAHYVIRSYRPAGSPQQLSEVPNQEPHRSLAHR